MKIFSENLRISSLKTTQKKTKKQQTNGFVALPKIVKQKTRRISCYFRIKVFPFFS